VSELGIAYKIPIGFTPMEPRFRNYSADLNPRFVPTGFMPNGVDLSSPPDPVSVEARLVSYTASSETDLLPPRFLLAEGEQKTGREEEKRILSHCSLPVSGPPTQGRESRDFGFQT